MPGKGRKYKKVATLFLMENGKKGAAMGCDFQMSGSQPDPAIRERCLNFLRKFDSMVPSIWPMNYAALVRAASKPEVKSEAKKGKSFSISVFGDTMYAKTPLVRMDRYPVFRKPDDFSTKYGSCATPAVWSKDAFAGRFAHGLPIVFDIAAGGILCSLHREIGEGEKDRQQPDWFDPSWLIFPEDRAACSRILLYPACHIRFGTGDPFYFVIAEVLKRRYIPDLQVAADYDVEIYTSLMKQTKYSALIAQIPEEWLPQLAVEASLQVGMLYHWDCERKLRLHDENERKLMILSSGKSLSEKTKKSRDMFNMRVEETNLSEHAKNCLKAAAIFTLCDLVVNRDSELVNNMTMNEASLAEIDKIMADMKRQGEKGFSGEEDFNDLYGGEKQKGKLTDNKYS
jgi:hypothetical protein